MIPVDNHRCGLSTIQDMCSVIIYLKMPGSLGYRPGEKAEYQAKC